MSFDQLREWNRNKVVEPPIQPDISSHEELAGQGRDINGIVAQRRIETGFTTMSPADPSSLPIDPYSDEGTFDLVDTFRSDRFQGILRKTNFALGYPQRLIRSAMALTGISATAERFGDVRKSMGFWTAMADLMNSLNPITPVAGGKMQIAQRSLALTKEIPEILAKPSVPEDTLPGVGRVVIETTGAPEQMEWIYDLVGELWIEANVIKVTKTVARKAASKLMKTTYEAGEQVQKRGIKHILGQMTDDEIAAIDDAANFRMYGTLGTKPQQWEIDDAMQRTFEYIKQSGDARLTKKQTITAARRQAAARMHAVQRSADKTGEYGPGLAARMRAAGRAEKAEKAFKPLLEVSTKAADDLTTLNKVIANHDFAGKIYTQANAHEALAKLYEYGELLTRGEVELLRDVLGHDFANALTKFTVKPVGVAGKAAAIGSKTLKGLAATSRTLMTTSELSFLLRQANFRAWTRPKDAVRSFAVAARSLLSPKYARHMDDAFRFSKAGKVGIEHGLFLGRFDEGARVLAREEIFMAEWLQNVPILKQTIGKVVKAFERGYVSGLNSIRLDWFDEGYRILERTGRAGNDDLVRKWAAYVNNMLGRADIDNIAKANKAMIGMAEVAKDVLFAPRFTASKWNRHRVAAQLMFGKETPNAMRRMLAGDTLLRWRRYERLAHYAKQNGFEVEENPQSADFLKIKVGDTRYDILGGDMQLQVLAARLVTGETKDTSTGLIKDILASEIAVRYAAGKLNPLWSLAVDKWVVGATFEGEDIDDPKVLAKTIRNKFIPLYLQDIKDKIFLEYETEGGTYADAIESGVSTIGLGFLGAGVQTYEPSARKEYELMVNDKAQELYAKDFADLVPYRKEEVLWEAENDDIDRTDRLKEEMGMSPVTRKTAAKMQKAQNKADRRVRDGLGTNYKLFVDSNIATNGLSATVQDVRLNAEQHDFLNDIYVKFIKRELRQYPKLADLKPEDFSRRQWLQDILAVAREDAKAELFFIEPEE
ncbi:hypothetical protein LCGC14_0928880 [marine sediment metagenome]|uniref:Uncharacterized protein n=1 Tax=marine sediment metagenome TaxID=412755 RepID=A0A0F9NT89_9ZZZZ